MSKKSRICKWCGEAYVPANNSVRYCSAKCKKESAHVATVNRRRAMAMKCQAMGMSMRSYMAQFVTGRGLARPDRHCKKKYKTYAEIKAYNAEHPLQSGWRGQPVLGGGGGGILRFI